MPHRHGHSRSPRLPLLSFPGIYEPGCYSTDRWVSTKHIAQNVWLWPPPQGLIVAAYKRSTRIKRRTAGVCQTQEPQPAHFLDSPLPEGENYIGRQWTGFDAERPNELPRVHRERPHN